MIGQNCEERDELKGKAAPVTPTQIQVSNGKSSSQCKLKSTKYNGVKPIQFINLTVHDPKNNLKSDTIRINNVIRDSTTHLKMFHP